MPTKKGEIVMEATKRPWELNSTCFEVKSDPIFWKQGIKHGGIQVATATGIGQEQAQANAQLIVRSVNNFESLLNACKVAVEMGDEYEALKIVKEAIRKAEAEA